MRKQQMAVVDGQFAAELSAACRHVFGGVAAVVGDVERGVGIVCPDITPEGGESPDAVSQMIFQQFHHSLFSSGS